MYYTLLQISVVTDIYNTLQTAQYKGTKDIHVIACTVLYEYNLKNCKAKLQYSTSLVLNTCCRCTGKRVVSIEYKKLEQKTIHFKISSVS